MLDQTTLLIRDADSRRESAPSDVTADEALPASSAVTSAQALRLAGEAREP